MPLPTIPSGNVFSSLPTGFSVDNSCRFNDGDAVQLYRDITSAGNRRTWTVSWWMKIGAMQAGCRIWSQGNTPSQNPFTGIELSASGAMTIFHYNGSYPFILEPTILLRDPSAWYHLVLSFDSTPSTPSSSSIKFFVNGAQQTAFGTETYPSQNLDTEVNNSTYDFYVGAYDGGNYFDGNIAEFCLIDGTAYNASTFGEYDEDSPQIWKPKDFSGDVTFGTNGFYLDFKDSSALGNDVSGNNNDLTATNLAAVDSATDTPTNNFCVMNVLDNYYAAFTYEEGNCKLINSTKGFATGTFGLTTGKWAWEVKPSAGDGAYYLIGIADFPTQGTGASNYLGYTALEYAYYAADGAARTNQNSPAYGATYAADDIIGVYLDLDNNKLYFSKNGTVQNSGTGISITAAASTTNGMYFPATGFNDTSAAVFEHNFGGCPAFAISSGNTDGTYGNFEYTTTITGDGASKTFKALCTKNLAEYG